MNRPLIFAHRGACRVAPENTLPAFQAAIDMGADGVELDVQYSSDGKVVVFHHPTLDATTDGTGRLTSYTLAELRALDAGSHFGKQFKGTQIPTLDEALDLMRGKIQVIIELKAFTPASMGLGPDTVAAVRAHNMADQVIISSFNALALRRTKKSGPELACALLLAPDLPAWTRWGFVRRRSRADALHPEAPMVNATYMARARGLGMPVRPWTVNDAAEMRRLIALGVDAIITDVPDVMKTLLSLTPE